MADTTTKNVLSVIATSSERVKDIAIQSGQLIFVQDRRRIAFDFKGKRVFYNQITELNSDEERLLLENPSYGYYFVINTAVLWFYDNEWIQITSRPEDGVVFVGVEFPELGAANKIYVDIDDREISVWNESTETYVKVANYTLEVENSDIESLFN